ncbi:MAG: hypothetical protein RR768_03145 [Clostridium sp.]
MQAKNIRITDAQRKNWMDTGTLQEKILEMSGVFVNQFHPSDSTRYWTEYNGNYEVELQALEGLQIQEGISSETVPVVFYMEENPDISITIKVEVTASQPPSVNGQDEVKSAESEQKKDTEQNASRTNVLRRNDRIRSWIWLIMTMVALTAYGCSLHSDFKVLRKYKRKRKEREGK